MNIPKRKEASDPISFAHLLLAQTYVITTSEKFKHLGLKFGPGLVSTYLLARYLVNVDYREGEFIKSIAKMPADEELKSLTDRQEHCDRALEKVRKEFQWFNKRVLCHAASIFLIQAFESPNLEASISKDCFAYRVQKIDTWPETIEEAMKEAHRVSMTNTLVAGHRCYRHVEHELETGGFNCSKTSPNRRRHNKKQLTHEYLKRSSGLLQRYTPNICTDIIRERRNTADNALGDNMRLTKKALDVYIHIEAAVSRSLLSSFGDNQQDKHKKSFDDAFGGVATVIKTFALLLRKDVASLYKIAGDRKLEKYVTKFEGYCVEKMRKLVAKKEGLMKMRQRERIDLLMRLDEKKTYIKNKPVEGKYDWQKTMGSFNKSFVHAKDKALPKKDLETFQLILRSATEKLIKNSEQNIENLQEAIIRYAQRYFWDAIMKRLPPEISGASRFGKKITNIRLLGQRTTLRELIMFFYEFSRAEIVALFQKIHPEEFINNWNGVSKKCYESVNSIFSMDVVIRGSIRKAIVRTGTPQKIFDFDVDVSPADKIATFDEYLGIGLSALAHRSGDSPFNFFGIIKWEDLREKLMRYRDKLVYRLKRRYMDRNTLNDSFGEVMRQINFLVSKTEYAKRLTSFEEHSQFRHFRMKTPSTFRPP